MVLSYETSALTYIFIFLVYKLSLLICRLIIHRSKIKDMTEGVHEARNSMMQIMTLKATTRGTL